MERLGKYYQSGCIDTLCAITGIEDMEVFQKEVNLYPNPFHEEINIDTQGKYQLAVYDAFGRLINYKQEVNNFSNLDLSMLQPGAYFVKIIFKEGQKVFRGVKSD